VKIAIIDSGIHPGHPHVGQIAGAVEITLAGERPDAIDRLGHGTAVAGAIREKAPDAELYAVKVFDRRLTANIGVILRALEWCRDHHMDLVNLSLGTENPAHRDGFLRILDKDLLVVSAASALPGSCRKSSAWLPIRIARATFFAIMTECSTRLPIRGQFRACPWLATFKG
jgi:subtilisin family serine protease